MLQYRQHGHARAYCFKGVQDYALELAPIEPCQTRAQSLITLRNRHGRSVKLPGAYTEGRKRAPQNIFNFHRQVKSDDLRQRFHSAANNTGSLVQVFGNNWIDEKRGPHNANKTGQTGSVELDKNA